MPEREPVATERTRLASAVYSGPVQHRRLEPRAHEFRRATTWLYLDLDELDEVFRGRLLWSVERVNLASFRRSDYLGPVDVPLKQAALDRVEAELGRRPAGPVRLLTTVRRFGWVFNPVSFYYCWTTAADGTERLDAIVAEITNTPWNERHAYVLDFANAPQAGRQGARRFEFAKQFHVSPFHGMDQRYLWSFTEPGEDLVVHMRNEEQGRVVFDVTLGIARRPFSGRELAGALLRQPLASFGVWLAIHFHALRLWLKRTPFHVHPGKREQRAPANL